MTIQGVIFDKDGTLFDFQATWGVWAGRAIADIANGDAAMFDRLADVWGYDADAQVLKRDSIVIASTPGEIWQAAEPVTGKTTAQMIADMKLDVADAPQVLVAGIKDALQALKDQGLRLGVMTNDMETSAISHLTRDGLIDMFDLVVGSDSGRGWKPDAGPLLSMVADWNLPASDVIMVGDSLHDLDAGRAAGMQTVGVLTGVATRDDLTHAATVVLDTASEVPAWIYSKTE